MLYFLFTCDFLSCVPWSARSDSHSDLGELLFGQVQRMVDHTDSVLNQVGASGQVCAQDGIVSNVHEGHHGVPALVIVPHLHQWWTVTQIGDYKLKYAHSRLH